MQFQATLELNGKTATGITVPDDVLAALGSGKRPPVRVTLRDHTFATTIGSMGGVAKIPVSSAARDAAGVAAGDQLEVRIELDTTPRTVAMPDDLSAALIADPAADGFFGRLTASQQKAFVARIEQAKKPETRAQRVAHTVRLLAEGNKRP